MENTIIKQKRIKNSNGINKTGVLADTKITNGSFREKLNEMIHSSGAAEKLKAVEKIAENTVKLGFEKAVAHFENPAIYPLPQESKTLERAVYELLSALPKKKRNRMIDKVNELLKAPAEKRKQVYGDIAAVNFKSSESIAEQVKNMPELKKHSLTPVEFEKLSGSFKTITKNINKPVPQQAVSAGTLGFFVDSMTCLNPDDVLKDEVSIGGFIIDSLGNTTELAPRFVGKFRKNETVNLGANNRLFTVNIDPFLAQQTFAANLFIIESDLVENRRALDIVIFVFALIGLTLLAVAAGIFVAGVLGAAVTLQTIGAIWIAGGVFNIFAHYFLPLMGDDISNFSTDVLFLDSRIDIGTEFTRTIEIGKGFDLDSTFDGKYTANARWVGEA